MLKLENTFTFASNNKINQILKMLKLGNTFNSDNSEKNDFVNAIYNFYNFYEKVIDADSNLMNLEDLERLITREQVTYDCKDLFANKIINSFENRIFEMLKKKVDILTATKEEKIKFYQENGYIIELQKDDSGNLTLACYCKELADSFSIHLKKLPENLISELTDINTINNENNLIATGKIEDNILKLSDQISYNCIKTIEDVIPIHSCFNSRENNVDATKLRASISLYNYCVFNEIPYIKPIREEDMLNKDETSLLKMLEILQKQMILSSKKIIGLSEKFNIHPSSIKPDLNTFFEYLTNPNPPAYINIYALQFNAHQSYQRLSRLPSTLFHIIDQEKETYLKNEEIIWNKYLELANQVDEDRKLA